MSDRVILLVEDNASDVALTLRALERGHIANPVDVVSDGAEALDYLFARGAHAARGAAPLPQVLLLDVKLPKIDGIRVLRQLRADPRTQALPVVMLTSSDEYENVRDSYALGANSYVRKPVEFTAFAEAVQKLGLYWVLVNRPPGSA